MQTQTVTTPRQSMQFDGADLEVRAQLAQERLTIDVMKAGNCVHRVVIDDAARRFENGWLAELFAREHRVALGTLAGEVQDYVDGLDVNQG